MLSSLFFQCISQNQTQERNSEEQERGKSLRKKCLKCQFYSPPWFLFIKMDLNGLLVGMQRFLSGCSCTGTYEWWMRLRWIAEATFQRLTLQKVPNHVLFMSHNSMTDGSHWKLASGNIKCEMIYRHTRRRLIESFELHSVSSLSDVLAVFDRGVGWLKHFPLSPNDSEFNGGIT